MLNLEKEKLKHKISLKSFSIHLLKQDGFAKCQVSIIFSSILGQVLPALLVFIKVFIELGKSFQS